MNNIDVQLWGNHEANVQKEMLEDIEWRKKDYLARKQFIDTLNERIGVFFQDLVTGPIYKHHPSTLEWRIPIAFNGATGYIESRDAGTAVIKIGTEMCRLDGYSLKNQAEIADWFERWTK
jgi:hypothetical protein